MKRMMLLVVPAVLALSTQFSADAFPVTVDMIGKLGAKRDSYDRNRDGVVNGHDWVRLRPNEKSQCLEAVVTSITLIQASVNGMNDYDAALSALVKYRIEQIRPVIDQVYGNKQNRREGLMGLSETIIQQMAEAAMNSSE